MKLNCKRIDFTYTPGEEIFTFPEESGLSFLFDVDEEPVSYTHLFAASANDAFAAIRITSRDSTEECYAEILDYLYAVLSQEEFPRSYSVEFRGKDKLYLPIPGLPKKGINQLFACAVQHPKLHTDIERYARLAMREYEWYQNLADEACAMPGSFAVFALGLEGEQWATLVAEYLDLCDDEHSSLQEKFLHADVYKRQASGRP